MSTFAISHLIHFSKPQFPAIKLSPEIGASIIEVVSSVAKTTICAIGTLFQAAKTLVKLPFAVVILPLTFVLEKVATYLIEAAEEDLKVALIELNAADKINEANWEYSELAMKAWEMALERTDSAKERKEFSEKMKNFAEDMSPVFFKDLIMTIHLVHFTFSDKEFCGGEKYEDFGGKYTVKGVFDIVSDVVCSRGDDYARTARSLWSDYMTWDAQCEETSAADEFEEALVAHRAVLEAPSVGAQRAFEAQMKGFERRAQNMKHRTEIPDLRRSALEALRDKALEDDAALYLFEETLLGGIQWENPSFRPSDISTFRTPYTLEPFEDEDSV